MFDINDISIDFRDETDCKLLQLAVVSKADYLITGDKDLLELENVKGTRIMKPAMFITEI